MHTGQATGPISDSAEARRLVPFLMILVLWAVPQGTMMAMGISPALQGGLVDPDSFMRLVRVLHLYETGAWFDGSVPRSNAPYGDVLHWTRPFDVILAAGALVLAPVMGFPAGLHWFGIVSAPLLTLAAAFTLGWAVRPMLGRERSHFAIIVFLTQPGILAYCMAGRADHHALQFLVFVLSIGLILRLLLARGGWWIAAATGAAAGLGIWVSVEFLLPVAVILGVLGVAWLRHGDAWAAAGLGFAAGMVAIVAAALLLERPLADVAAVEYDRISVVHLTVAAIAIAFWLAALVSNRFMGTVGARLLFGVIGAAVAVAALYAAFPKFFVGPMVDVDPRLFTVWMDHVGELDGLLPTNLETLGRFLFMVGPAVICLPYAIAMIWRQRNDAAWACWLFLAVAIAAFFALSLKHVRFAPFAEIAFAPVLAAILGRMREWVDWIRQQSLRDVARAVVSTVLLVGFIGTGSVVAAAAADKKPAQEDWACPIDDMAAYLDRPDGHGDRSRIIVALLDHGPALIYGSRHAVIAAPYHRNTNGILDVHRIMTGAVDAEARRLIDERGADLVLLCPNRVETKLFSKGANGVTLYSRLLDGSGPEWLRPVDLPPELARTFRLFEVAG
ncbi:MAG: hypothetical protein MI806_15985 [Minwuiales bacterium]|nr:hypothetical protein [Minwuiales bacterium]